MEKPKGFYVKEGHVTIILDRPLTGTNDDKIVENSLKGLACILMGIELGGGAEWLKFVRLFKPVAQALYDSALLER